MRNYHIKHIFIIFILHWLPFIADAKNISSNQFIYQLKNSDAFVHAKTMTTSVADKYELYNQIVNSATHTNIRIDSEILKIASGVKCSDHVWQFNNESINDNFASLFESIALNDKQWGFNVSLSPYDLFHGHLFALHNAGALEDIGILFHAKEYPRDLTLGNPDAEKYSPFTSRSYEFAYRNFIWLASSGFIYDIDSYASAIYPRYFLPADITSRDPSMKEIIRLYLQAKTLFLENLGSNVEPLGDINYFIINGKPVIFFTL